MRTGEHTSSSHPWHPALFSFSFLFLTGDHTSSAHPAQAREAVGGFPERIPTQHTKKERQPRPEYPYLRDYPPNHEPILSENAFQTYTPKAHQYSTPCTPKVEALRLRLEVQGLKLCFKLKL
jgi:hypothetical protein